MASGANGPRKEWSTVGALAALSLIACASHKNTRPTSAASVEGTVVDADTGSPMESVRIVLCARPRRASVSLIGMYAGCDTEVSTVTTDSSGWFHLTWESGQSPDGSRIEVIAGRYLPFIIPTAVPPSQGSAKLAIRLRRAPLVEVTVIDADGKPITHGSVGWLVEEAGSIRSYYFPSFSGVDGRPWFDPEGVPEGQVTLFVTADDQAPSFATSTITTKSGGHYSVTLKTDQPLFKIRGTAVAADNSPLAALVSVEPVQPKAFSALDRVLLEARGQDTDTEGNFEFRITSPAEVMVRLSTWVGRGQREDHVHRMPLAGTTAEFRVDPKPVVLRAPAAPLVRCTMVAPDNTPVTLAEIGLFFVPHQDGRGHSGSCVWAGGKSSPDRDPIHRQPLHVNFIWPSAVETLLVRARSTAWLLPSGVSQSYIGEVALGRATDPCQIQGVKEP